MDQRKVSELTVDELANILAGRLADRMMNRLRHPAHERARLNSGFLIGDADRKWGFHFGVDGAIDEKELRRLLGGVSDKTVDARCAAGLIRRGKDVRRVVFCRRSVMQYLAGLEE